MGKCTELNVQCIFVNIGCNCYIENEGPCTTCWPGYYVYSSNVRISYRRLDMFLKDNLRRSLNIVSHFTNDIGAILEKPEHITEFITAKFPTCEFKDFDDLEHTYKWQLPLIQQAVNNIRNPLELPIVRVKIEELDEDIRHIMLQRRIMNTPRHVYVLFSNDAVDPTCDTTDDENA